MEKLAMPPSRPRPASAVSFADDEEEAISGEDEFGVNGAEEEEQPDDDSSSAENLRSRYEFDVAP